jgi:3-oxoacyl-[acyl-carrier-protein] synthase II
VNAHGTSTPLGDPAETAAIKLALGDHAYKVPISSTKSMTGHLSAGAGSLEAAICIQALRTNLIPPTINLDTPDPACDLDYVPHRTRQAEVDIVLSNSFGFGGHNAVLVLKGMD